MRRSRSRSIGTTGRSLHSRNGPFLPVPTAALRGPAGGGNVPAMASAGVVLLTGHPAVGKSSFAPRLAEALGAVCLSKDEVRYRVFDGWQPRHPVLDGVGELRVGASVLSE